MSSDEVVLRVRHVSKRFEIYDKPRHRLQQMLFGPYVAKLQQKGGYLEKTSPFSPIL